VLVTSDEWTRQEFAIEDFDASDGKDVLGIWFGASKQGPFEFQIDEVILSK
jgi:hypothetical protein